MYFDNIQKEIDKIKEVREQAKNFKYVFKKERRKARIKTGARPNRNLGKLKRERRDERRFLKRLKKRLKIAVRSGKHTKGYYEYIKSNEWDARKNRYYRTHQKKCVICGSTDFVNLHHAVYGDFGNEKDEHLFAFCRFHHEGFHEEYGVKGNMLAETMAYILWKK